MAAPPERNSYALNDSGCGALPEPAGGELFCPRIQSAHARSGGGSLSPVPKARRRTSPSQEGRAGETRGTKKLAGTGWLPAILRRPAEIDAAAEA